MREWKEMVANFASNKSNVGLLHFHIIISLNPFFTYLLHEFKDWFNKSKGWMSPFKAHGRKNSS